MKALYKKYGKAHWTGDGVKQGQATSGNRCAWRKNKHAVRAQMDREIWME